MISTDGKKPLFNPLSKDLVVLFRGDDNMEVPLTMKAMEISYFAGYQYEFMKKHMADAIYDERGQKTNHDDDIAVIKREVDLSGRD